jgi:hypothetical protein
VWLPKLLLEGLGFKISLLFIYRGIAQLAERWSPKPEVAGSIPSAPAKCNVTALDFQNVFKILVTEAAGLDRFIHRLSCPDAAFKQ